MLSHVTDTAPPPTPELEAADPQPGSSGHPRVIVADDQPAILDALRLLLSDEGFTVEMARSPQQLLVLVEAAVGRGRDPDAVLMDLNYARDTTSGREGLALLPRLLAVAPALPIVVMTAWGSVEGAVEAMRRGARDYVEKPWDDARLVTTLRAQVELGRALRRTQRLEGEVRQLRHDAAEQAGVAFIAGSAAMQPVLRLMERIAPSDANVLITGEHGTGKELIARWLHAASARSGHAMVTVNVGGLSEGVFESELFGHVRGAFTDAKADRVGRFELADGGTLFLDEVGNLSRAQQATLLRVLQAGELERVGSSRTRRVDVRLVTATNIDLRAEVSAGRFREDLLYRLNTVELHLPPLRARREDLPSLAAHFLSHHAARYRRPLKGFEPAALTALLAHGWPGNVRELDHAIERAVLMAQGPLLRAADLALQVERGGAPALEEMTLEEAERLLIGKALERWRGNVSHAAKALGLSRSALYRRMAEYGL